MTDVNEGVLVTKVGENLVHIFREPDDFIRYQEKYNTGFSLNKKEADTILSYMDGHGYVLGVLKGEFYRGDLEEVQGSICWEPYTMDDAIDMACEWNYEFILEEEAKMSYAGEDFSENLRYQVLKQDEIVLDKLFDTTKYGKEVSRIAETLADYYIKKFTEIETEMKELDIKEEIGQVKTGNRERSR